MVLREKEGIALSLTIDKSEYIVENIVGAALGHEMETLRVFLRVFVVIDQQLPGDQNNYAAGFPTGVGIESTDLMIQFLKR